MVFFLWNLVLATSARAETQFYPVFRYEVLTICSEPLAAGPGAVPVSNWSRLEVQSLISWARLPKQGHLADVLALPGAALLFTVAFSYFRWQRVIKEV